MFDCPYRVSVCNGNRTGTYWGSTQQAVEHCTLTLLHLSLATQSHSKSVPCCLAWLPASAAAAAAAAAAGHGSFSCVDCVPDSVNGAKFVRDLYENAQDTTGMGSCACML
jgi:hypothetical protein